MPLTVSPRRARRGPIALALLALVALVIPGAVWAAKPAPTPNVNIQILNVSDWHANLDPASSAGGAWNISARWDADEAAFSGPTLRLTAGDDFGAAPPLSGFFDEVPSIQAQRLMGIQVNTFGNHNFDAGITHLQSMIDLAAAPSTGSGGAHPGSPFRYVATNLANLDANLTGVDRIKYFTLGGVKVAVLGIVNEEAPTLVSPGNFGTILVTDGVAATKAAAREARQNGAKAVIVITHKGVTNASDGTGPLTDFVNALPGGLVDVVIGDHTNIQYSGTGALNGVLYHENLSFGNSYAKTFLTVKGGKSGAGVIAKSVTFVTPGPAGSLSTDKTSCTGTGATATFCDQDIVTMLVPYRALLSQALDGVIGTTLQPFDRGGNIERRREMPLGDLLADGLRATYGVQIGYYTGGSIRTQFPACGYAPADTTLNRSNWNGAHTTIGVCPGGYDASAPYDLVKGDVYSVLPFGNNIVTRQVTGMQLWQALENGVSQCPNPITSGSTCAGRFPQVSGIKFTFNTANATGCSGSEVAPITWACVPSRVTAVTWSDGTPIAYDGTLYTFATTDFTNNGGDSYTMLHDGQGVSRDRDANQFLAYLSTLTFPLDPASMVLDRITCTAPCNP